MLVLTRKSGESFLVGSDIVLASVPGALINKLTIRYHLQEIGIHWIGWFFPAPSTEAEYRMVFGEGFSAATHVLIVVAITVVALGFGARLIVSRDYITSDET